MFYIFFVEDIFVYLQITILDMLICEMWLKLCILKTLFLSFLYENDLIILYTKLHDIT